VQANDIIVATQGNNFGATGQVVLFEHTSSTEEMSEKLPGGELKYDWE
jgi:hypothetical protein